MTLHASLAPRPITSSVLATTALLLSICMTPSAAWAAACDAVVEASGTVGVNGVTHTSIQAAVDHYKAFGCNGVGGTTIEIRAGMYRESVSLFGVLGAAGSPLEIVANAGMTLEPGSARGFEFRNSAHITLRGLPGAAISTGTNEPVAIQGGSAANSNIVIVGWDIHDNGGGKDSACIDIAPGNANVRVENVLCRDNGSTAIHVGAGGPHEIVNNTIVRNDKHGILIENGADVTVANNLVAFNGSSGGTQFNIKISTKGRGTPGVVTLLNNIAYGVDGDIDGPFAGGGNLDTAALGAGIPIGDFFVNPAANDFHLKAGSPAIGAGLPVSDPLVPATDFEADPRFANADDGYDELLPDLDRDGVADFIDNCPPDSDLHENNTHNPTQADRDGDGIGDRCDNCWDKANPNQLDTDCPATHLGNACPVISNDSAIEPECLVESVVDFQDAAGMEGTSTVPPICDVNLHFICERFYSVPEDPSEVGVPIPQAFFYYGDLSASIAFIARDELSFNTCDLAPHLPPAATVGQGRIKCNFLYRTDVVPENCDPSQTNPQDPDCLASPNSAFFQGEIPAGTITVELGDQLANDTACSPGFFKNNLADWLPTGLSPADDFDATFETDAYDPDITLFEAINTIGGNVNLLTRKAVSALLSAQHPDIAYQWSPDQVKIIVQDGIDDDPLGSATEAANKLPVSATSVGGCPLSIIGS